MLTAEEFFKRENLPIDILSGDDINYAMIEFAKLHVKAALEAATKSIECYLLEEQSILNAYNLDNIK